MGTFIEMFVGLWRDILALLDNTIMHIGNFNVSITDMLFVFFAVSMVISVFWRGGRA